MMFELHPQVKEADPEGKLLFQTLGLTPSEICAMQGKTVVCPGERHLSHQKVVGKYPLPSYLFWISLFLFINKCGGIGIPLGVLLCYRQVI